MSEQPKTAPEIVIDKAELKHRLSLLTDEDIADLYRLVMGMGGAAGE